MNTELTLSIVVASATTIYTIITILQLIESRKVRFQKLSPNVLPYLKLSENFSRINLYIENFGEGIARNVKVNFINDFERFGHKDFSLSTLGISRNGMNYFTPNYKLKYSLGFMEEIYTNFPNEILILEISYTDWRNKKYKTTYSLPFNELSGQTKATPPDDYLGQIPHYLNELNKKFDKLIKEHS